MNPPALPLAGLRVIEMTHMVMGPVTGLILADLGADVIKIEPPGKPGQAGDHTRYLKNTGAGFFAACNRNKQSVILDVEIDQDRQVLAGLLREADIFVENFRPDALAARGLDYASVARMNQRLVYCSLKGFLDGPYAQRTALDEVVQMMSGLAYMTGPVGQPLRAGAPVNDMMGGMFGAIAVMAAVRVRDMTGRGQHVKSALFENAAWLVSTHMLQHAITGDEPPPMSAGQRAWGIYDVFHTVDARQIFIGVVTERQWLRFTDALGEPALWDAKWASNNARALDRATLIPLVATLLARRSLAELQTLCTEAGLPFAPIARPWDLYDDAHLQATDGLLEVTLPDKRKVKVPGLPIQLDDRRLGVRRDIPLPGEHTQAVRNALQHHQNETV